MAKITGGKKFKAELERLQKVNKRIVQVLYSQGQKIELDAEHSITKGGISGPGHTPSLPGQPPNADTHFLDTNIETTIVATNPPTVHVTSHAKYSVALEYGTSRMAERPFMRPAAKKNRKATTEAVRKALTRKV